MKTRLLISALLLAGILAARAWFPAASLPWREELRALLQREESWVETLESLGGALAECFAAGEQGWN